MQCHGVYGTEQAAKAEWLYRADSSTAHTTRTAFSEHRHSVRDCKKPMLGRGRGGKKRGGKEGERTTKELNGGLLKIGHNEKQQAFHWLPGPIPRQTDRPKHGIVRDGITAKMKFQPQPVSSQAPRPHNHINIRQTTTKQKNRETGTERRWKASEIPGRRGW